MQSTRAWLSSVLILACLALSGGVEAANKKKTGKPPPPPPPIPSDASLGFFDNTRDELLGNIKRVGVMPIRDIPASLRDRDDAKQALIEAVMKYLRAANFEVVGPASYQAIYDRFNKQLGGMYDASTGEMKRDVASAVLQNAQREFVSKERLDGYVYIRVRSAAAGYSDDYVSWDGVRERSDGQPPPSNAFTEFWTASDTKGTLPALSLLVQMVNKQERVVYGRHGGIQAVAYHRWIKGSDIGFQFVASADQLKDLERIDRAARVATLPLVHTPKEISLGDADPQINALRVDLSKLPPLPEGRLFVNDSPLLVPREQILQSVHRVALSPLNTHPFTVPDYVQKIMMDGIRSELATLNWEVVDAPNAIEMLVKALLETKLFDPLTGKRDEAKTSAVRKSVFNALGINPVPDAILWVDLSKTVAVHRGGDVEWDGANQNGITMGPVIKKLFIGASNEPGAGSGGVAAVSLSVYLADANDTPLYRSRGGVELLQKLKYIPPTTYSGGHAEPVDLAPSELFHEHSRAEHAPHYALRDLVLTPEALAAELNPVPEKKKKTKK